MGLGMLRTMGALMVVGALCTSGCSLGGDAEAKKEASEDDSKKKKKKKKDDEDADEETAESEPAEDSNAEVADNRTDNTKPHVYPYPTTTYKTDTPDAFGKSNIGDNKTGTTNTKSLTDKPDDKTASKTTTDKPSETPPDNTGSGKKAGTEGRGIPAPPGGRPRPGTK
jgi:hypothetical protein